MTLTILDPLTGRKVVVTVPVRRPIETAPPTRVDPDPGRRLAAPPLVQDRSGR
jgi:hypothetical protein